jgi:hypothetical protein
MSVRMLHLRLVGQVVERFSFRPRHAQYRFVERIKFAGKLDDRSCECHRNSGKLLVTLHLYTMIMAPLLK